MNKDNNANNRPRKANNNNNKMNRNNSLTNRVRDFFPICLDQNHPVLRRREKNNYF